MNGRRIALTSAVTLMGATAACSGSGGLLYLSPAPAGSCILGGMPPPAEAIMDTERVLPALSEAGAASWSAVLVLDPDTAGEWERVELLEVRAQPPDDLEELVGSHLGPPPGGSGEPFLLRLDRGSEPSVRTGAREMCVPVLREPATAEQNLRAALSDAFLPGTERIVLRLRVDETGRVVDLRVQEEAFGLDVQRRVTAFARDQLRFRPGTIDRKPAALWVQIPFTLHP